MGSIWLLLLILAFLVGFLGLFIWTSYFTASEMGKKPPQTFQRVLQIVVAGFGFVVLLFLPLISFVNAIGATGLSDFVLAHPKPTPADLSSFHMAFTSQTLFYCVMGFLQILLLVPAVRYLLSKSLFPKIDSSRRVHTIALMLWFTGAGTLLYTLLYAFDPQMYAELLKSVPMDMMGAGQTLIFILFCPLALGWGLKRNWREMLERLGIRKFPLKTVPLFIGFGLALVAIMALVNPLLQPYIDPEVIKVAESMSESLVGNKTVPQVLLIALLVGLSAGIGEELIFRGLLQPVLGWVAANLLFTLMHCHYGFSVILIQLFLLGAANAYIRNRYGTVPAMITHASFDFLEICREMLMHLH